MKKPIKKRSRRRNPIQLPTPSEYFEIPTLTDFKHPNISKVEYFRLGADLGFSYGLKNKYNEDFQNEIVLFYDQLSSTFTGLGNKTNQEAFEAGIISGLKRSVDYTGDESDARYEIYRSGNNVNTTLNKFKIGLKFKRKPKLATLYK